MEKEEFYSKVEISPNVRLPYFRGKHPMNFIAETAKRGRALLGRPGPLALYGAWLFIESQVNSIRNFGKRPYKYNEAYSIYRDMVNRLKYMQKNKKVY